VWPDGEGGDTIGSVGIDKDIGDNDFGGSGMGLTGRGGSCLL
jgi:hypothetical protein